MSAKDKKKKKQTKVRAEGNDPHRNLGRETARQLKAARKALKKAKLPQNGFGVAFLGSARTRPGHPYYDKTVEAAQAVAALGYPIIHGGGPGQMEASARGAKAASGASIGLCLKLGFKEEVQLEHDLSIWFDEFSPRLDTFRHLSRVAMVFTPGGIGSMHEAMSIIDHIMQKKAERRLIIFYEPCPEKPYWEGFFQWLRGTVMADGLLKEEEISFLKIARSCEELVQLLQSDTK